MMTDNFALNLQSKSKFKFRQTNYTQPAGSPTRFAYSRKVIGKEETLFFCGLKFSADTATEEYNSCPF